VGETTRVTYQGGVGAGEVVYQVAHLARPRGDDIGFEHRARFYPIIEDASIVWFAGVEALHEHMSWIIAY